MDGYKNLSKKIGTGEGLTSGSFWESNYLTDIEKANLYDTNGLISVIVNAPIKDAYLTGIKAEDNIKDIYNEYSDLIYRAISLSRAFGISYFFFTDTDTAKVLEIQDVTTDTIELNPLRDDYLIPKNLSVVATGDSINVNDVYFVVQDATNHYKMNHNGEGVSVITKVNEAVKNYDVGVSQAVDIIGELNLNVYKMEDLNAVIADGREDELMQRLAVINNIKSNNSTILLDGNDDFLNVNRTLAGIRDILEECAISICALSKIPYSRLFGKQNGGLNGTGKQDLINYYDTVVSDIREEFIRPIFNEILKRKGLDSSTWEFEPIYQDSPKERNESEKIEIENIGKLLDMGLIGESEAKERLGL